VTRGSNRSDGSSLAATRPTSARPDVLDNKYYVRGIGLVREQTIQGGRDVLEFVSVTGP
jgi:hypothetical protein